MVRKNYFFFTEFIHYSNLNISDLEITYEEENKISNIEDDIKVKPKRARKRFMKSRLTAAFKKCKIIFEKRNLPFFFK